MRKAIQVLRLCNDIYITPIMEKPNEKIANNGSNDGAGYDQCQCSRSAEATN